MTPADRLIEAAASGDLATVSALLDADPALLQTRDRSGISLVLLAIYRGHRHVADLLIERGATLDLYDACATGTLARVERLIDEEPALANSRSADGHTPLGLAAFFGHLAIVELLLAAGAEVNAASQNAQQVTALHAAAARRDEAIARTLLRQGADVHARQQGGFQPLHASAQNGDLETARLLIQHGADPCSPTLAGQTAIDLARAAGHRELAAWMQSGTGVG